MPQMILLALTLGSFSTLLSAGHFIHRRYTEAMTQEIRRFELDWKQLEQKYETHP